jgi:hypothetical protein
MDANVQAAKSAEPLSKTKRESHANADESRFMLGLVWIDA